MMLVSKIGFILISRRWPLFTAAFLLVCVFIWAWVPSSKWHQAAPLHTARYKHCAILLPDGKLLIIGGTGPKEHFLASCEIYNPATETWSDAAPMANARSNFRAHLLSTGQVFVIGGEDPSEPASAEIYTPQTNSWSVPHELPLALNTKSDIPDGTLTTDDNFEISDDFGGHIVYNPVSSKIQVIRALKEPAIYLQARFASTFIGPKLPVIVPLKTGCMSIEDGNNLIGPTGAKTLTNNPYSSIACYYGFYTTVTFSIPIGSSLGITTTNFGLVDARYDGENSPFNGISYVVLPSGKVLGTGGMGIPSNWEVSLDLLCDHCFHRFPLRSPGPDGTPFTEVLDLSGNKWRPTWTMTNDRAYHSATLLRNGKVLVVGGREHGKPLFSCEIIDAKELDP